MEKDIIHIALENLPQHTDVEGFWEETGPLDGVDIPAHIDPLSRI